MELFLICFKAIQAHSFAEIARNDLGPHPEEPCAAGRLEGWGAETSDRPMVRDAACAAPPHDALPQGTQRGLKMITAAPARQTAPPIRSKRSGRAPSMVQSQSSEATT